MSTRIAEKPKTKVAIQMEAKGFVTDASLATRVGCERSMVTRIKLGKAKPSLELAVRLGDALDLPVSEFLIRKEKKRARSAAA